MTSGENRQISAVTLVVPDYQAGLDFYVDCLGFGLIEDTDLGGGKRWVLLAAGRGAGVCLLLAKADGPVQRAAIGKQTGGRVAFFLTTDNFERDFAAYSKKGVRFLETPRRETYGRVVVFEDPFGNKWDLIQPA